MFGSSMHSGFNAFAFNAAEPIPETAPLPPPGASRVAPDGRAFDAEALRADAPRTATMASAVGADSSTTRTCKVWVVGGRTRDDNVAINAQSSERELGAARVLELKCECAPLRTGYVRYLV